MKGDIRATGRGTWRASCADMGGRAKVLVVEDDADLRAFYAMVLRGSYDVTGAEDGLDALECVEQCRFDMVLLDLNMPRMGGAEFAIELRRRGVAIPIILCSATPGIEVEAERMGARHYCQKPCARARLLELVASAIDWQRVQGES